MSIKKKAATVGITVSLVGGAFVAGASSQTFGEYIKAGSGVLIAKVAGWAGYTVADNAEKKEDEVNNHVKSEFTRGATEAGKIYNEKVNAGNAEITQFAADYKKAVTNATNEGIEDTRAKVQDEVTKEVSSAKIEIDADAKAIADQMMKQWDNDLKPAPAKPER